EEDRTRAVGDQHLPDRAQAGLALRATVAPASPRCATERSRVRLPFPQAPLSPARSRTPSLTRDSAASCRPAPYRAWASVGQGWRGRCIQHGVGDHPDRAASFRPSWLLLVAVAGGCVPRTALM